MTPGMPVMEGGATTTTGRPEVRILVVDDRPENLLALSTVLEAPDRTIVSAASGRDALRELLRRSFALILLDVNMPDIDGFETAQLIRQRPSSAHTPIIFVTAQHDAGFAAKSYALGAVDYISTPVNAEVLRAKAAVFVELFRKTEENRAQAERLRRAEERLRRRAEERLRQADERLRLVVESVKDYAIFSLDPEGRIAGWNAGAERLFGYSGAEAIGSDPAVLFAEDGRGKDGPAAAWRVALSQGRSEVEAWFERKGGERFFGRGVVSAMRAPGGELLGFSSVVHDATDRKRAETALQRQAEQLQEANRLKDEFLAVLSHELRTPLNAIIGWTHMLQRERLDPVTVRQAVDAVARNSRIQLALINDILDVSRFVAGKVRLALSPVDVRDAARGAVETALPTAEAKGIEITLDLPDEPLVVNGDADRLQQVLWNLVSNAVKFTPPGGHVQVTGRRAGSDVNMSVTDDGVGIPRSFLPHVFERFRQADSSTVRAHGGLGLGLAIVRHLVELHGGFARADSEGEGRGATFEVLFPAKASAPMPAPPPRRLLSVTRSAPVAATADEAPPATIPGLKCLVVDDDPDAREMLKAVLERRGMIVTAAASAEQALSLLPGVHLLLADIGMPVEDGYSLIRRVRALPADAGGRVPAIALTAYASEKDRRQALDAGFDRHLAKPVEHSLLFRVVAELLNQASTRPGSQAMP